MESRKDPPKDKRRSLLMGSSLLGAALLITAVATSLVAVSDHGALGALAATCAFAVCWFSGSVALAITIYTAGGPQSVSGMLLSMAVRTGLPLAAGVMAGIAGSPLIQAGLFGLIVVHYLVGLITETCFSVRSISQFNRKAAIR